MSSRMCKVAAIQALWIKRRPRVGRRQLIASPVILQQRPRSPRRPLRYNFDS